MAERRLGCADARLGAVPVTDVDEEGYWTVAAGEAAPWRIVDAAGEPIEASEEVQAAQFRSVTMAEGRVKVVLTGGGELSAAKVDGLSAAGTANCYVVSTPGTYAFNAKVRGNGAGEAASAGFDPAIEIADGMKADWIWTDREGLVSDVVLDKESGRSSSRSARAGATRWWPSCRRMRSCGAGIFG